MNTENPRHKSFSSSKMQQLGISFPVIIAPMVGLSHVAFRELMAWYTPAGLKVLCFTEMLSTKRIPHENMKNTLQLRCYPNEDFFVPQLLGNDEKDISQSIAKLLPLNPWGFDINMGCPVSHILKHNWGVRLLGQPDYAAQVVSYAKKHSPKPVSVKLRGGTDESMDFCYLDKFTKTLEDAGVDWLTIHARPRAQGHKGLADWSIPAQLAQNRKIPVVANGDIQTSEDVIQIISDLKCDGAMLARAAVAKPWLVWQIAEDLGWQLPPTAHAQRNKAPRTPEEEGEEFAQAALFLLRSLKKHLHDDAEVLYRFAFFLATASKWYLFGHAFWKLSTQFKSYNEALEKVEYFAARFQNPSCKQRAVFL